jgi:hypothetical protein
MLEDMFLEEKLEIRPEGGEEVSRPLAGEQKRKLLKERSVERLVFPCWRLSRLKIN